MMTACTSPASTRASGRAMPGRFRLLADSPPSTMMSINSALWTTAMARIFSACASSETPRSACLSVEGIVAVNVDLRAAHYPKERIGEVRLGPNYFHTMGTAFVAGRDFDERDNLKAPKVAIVNEEFAKVFFNGQSPVGRAFRQEGGAGKPDDVYQIVGLVRNTKYYELREDFRPIAFLPFAQAANPNPSASFVLRTSTPLGEFYKAA